MGFSLDGAAFSRIIEREEGDKKVLSVRIYNPCDSEVTATLKYGKAEIKVVLPAGKIEEVDLNKAFGGRFCL